MKTNIFHKLFATVLMAILLLPVTWVHANKLSDTVPGKRITAPVSEPTEPLPTDQIIIKLKKSDISAQEEQVIDALGRAVGEELRYLRTMSGGGHVIALPERRAYDDVAEITRKLMTLSNVEYAEPDMIQTHTLVPDDPRYSDQWHYTKTSTVFGINLPAAWDITTGSSDVVVAVIDTGITNHADLSGKALPGYDFIANPFVANDTDGRDTDPSDPGDWTAPNECYSGSPAEDSSWHGTHVAGTIGANTNNSTGVAGVAWGAKILPVRVLGKCGGYTSDIVDGMRWAAGLSVSGVSNNANPAQVLNLSLGGYGACSSTWQNAINEIRSAGSTIVVAAGNSNDNVTNYVPANCNGVITVGATDTDGYQTRYSNYGSAIEISAPGGDFYYDTGILSTVDSGTTVQQEIHINSIKAPAWQPHTSVA